MKHGSSRRQFLKGTFGTLGGTIAAYITGLFPEVQTTLAQTNREIIPLTTRPTSSGAGELYGEFVLLPEGAPVPSYVQDYRFGIPTMCNVGATEISGGGAIHKTLPTPELLAKQGGFPVYKLDADAPTLQAHNIQFSDASLITHNTGEIFDGWVNYISYDQINHVAYTCLSIMMQVDFPKPQPLWSSSPVEDGGKALVLQKVDYLPGGFGIKTDAFDGFTLHWILNNTYYMLISQNLPGIEAQTIASNLELE